MKTYLLLTIGLLSIFCTKTKAQCTFISPTVELNYVQTDIDGNCIVNFNLGFEIDINNGNKIIFLHLWRTQDYNDFNYKTQSQPKESNVLADAIATVIIDNEYLNNNPGGPASNVFISSYGPDPGIDDNTGAAQNQVLDASDGLTYSRVVVDAGASTYRYTVSNLQVTLPGACASNINFTGDAWSSNGNSASSSVQCTMEGYSFIVNDPKITSTLVCASPNKYSTTISTSSPFNLQFVYDVFVDNGDGFFDEDLDIQFIDGSGPYTITTGSPYNSGLVAYPAPYSTTEPWRQNSLWVRVRNMQLINNTVNPPTVTAISNALLDKTLNPSCGVLPISLTSFSAIRNGSMVVLNWQTAHEQNVNGFTIERSIDGTNNWQQVAAVPSQGVNGNSSSSLLYSYTDKNAVTGAFQYRIKQIDINGEIKYSEIRFVKASDFSKERVLVYPNPSADGKVVVVFNGNGTKNDVILQDVTGRKLNQWFGVATSSLQIANLKAGVYNLVVRNLQTNTQEVKKILVK
ncbi:MAG: T9SS type A sorting domain-containing protein [Bacteroidota bacterium]